MLSFSCCVVACCVCLCVQPPRGAAAAADVLAASADAGAPAAAAAVATVPAAAAAASVPAGGGPPLPAESGWVRPCVCCADCSSGPCFECAFCCCGCCRCLLHSEREHGPQDGACLLLQQVHQEDQLEVPRCGQSLLQSLATSSLSSARMLACAATHCRGYRCRHREGRCRRCSSCHPGPCRALLRLRLDQTPPQRRGGSRLSRSG